MQWMVVFALACSCQCLKGSFDVRRANTVLETGRAPHVTFRSSVLETAHAAPPRHQPAPSLLLLTRMASIPSWLILLAAPAILPT